MRRLVVLVAGVLAATSIGSTAIAGAAPTAARPPVLHFHTHSPAVKIVQRTLGVKPVSGYFGNNTRAAVRAFQARMGLWVNGIVDAPTWAALGPSVSRAAARVAAPAQASTHHGHSDESSGAGRRVCPVARPVWSDGFGADRGDHSHQGIDILSHRGAPIYAVDNGLITGAGMQGNGAIVVDIVGSRGMWFYGHFDKIVVKYGHHVKAGDLLGYMGDTGAYGAVHLHIEYHPGGEFPSPAVDPEPLLRSLC